LSKSIGIRATHDFEQFGNALDLLLSNTHYNNREQEELQHNVDKRIKLDNKTYTSPNDITIKQMNFPHSYLIDIMVEHSHYH
jgi:NAD kinase